MGESTDTGGDFRSTVIDTFVVTVGTVVEAVVVVRAVIRAVVIEETVIGAVVIKGTVIGAVAVEGTVIGAVVATEDTATCPTDVTPATSDDSAAVTVE